MRTPAAVPILSGLLHPQDPDIPRLARAGDIPSLIRLLRHDDPRIQEQASAALASLGVRALPALARSLRSRSVFVRLGAAEALGAIRDSRVLPALVPVMNRDPASEVRLAAILAAGRSGSREAVPALVPLLRDPDRYVRLGSATMLEELGWKPGSGRETADLCVARQDWDTAGSLGASAAASLENLLRDPDPATRRRAVAILAQIGTSASPACRAALADRDARVRWKAVLASLDAGIAPHELPIRVAGRERTGPDPLAAAILNFLFLGIGYNYLGKWWGFPLFMTYTLILVLFQLGLSHAGLSPFLAYGIAYPLTAIAGVQSYYAAERIADAGEV